MIITVASGKGGTGKTSVAVNLAAAVSKEPAKFQHRSVWLADCDVEAPNDALFLAPRFSRKLPVKWMIPEINADQCNLCGRCAEVCAYNAIAITAKIPIIFKDLCHACGSCSTQCPQKAITEVPEEIGVVEIGEAEELKFVQGLLTIGFSSAVPVIREMKRVISNLHENGSLIIRDSSPGTSCPVVECLRDSDFALLVTEPTPFGLHDLKLIAEIVLQNFNLPAGVVINKSNGEDGIITEFCKAINLPILMRIPMSRKIAEIYSRGELLINVLQDYKLQFAELLSRIETMVYPVMRPQ
jgi:MinD superfamily P-loop ATPase